MIEAAELGKFDMRNKVGQAWAAHLKLNPDEYKKYNAKNMPEKKEHRKQWAKETYSHVKASKSHERSYKHVDLRHGKYYSFGSLVISYGGWEWPPAVLAAKRHALRCGILGGDWIQTDGEFSGIVHFCKMEIEFSKVHEQAWQQHTQWSNGQESIPVENDDGGGGGVVSNRSSGSGNPVHEGGTVELAKGTPKA